MTIEEMKELKKAKGYSYGQIADYSGVPLSTVQKVFSGATDSPRYDTLLSLERFFTEEDRLSCVREAFAYKCEPQQGDKTLKDFYELPDDMRAELIDGVLYDMEAPTTSHQLIAGEIHFQIMDYIRGKNGECIPFTSPVDVQLDCDDKTMLEPDVLIVCNPKQIIRRCVYGAPDFVVEVLSDTSVSRDCIKKLNKYKNAGVREYWIINPKEQTVLTYDFEHELSPQSYTFADKIPMAIYQGELEIDLSRLIEMVAHIESLDE